MLGHEDISWALGRLSEAIEANRFNLTTDTVYALREFAGISEESWQEVGRWCEELNDSKVRAESVVLGVLIAGMAVSHGTEQ